MENAILWFEIPVKDMQRARSFYQEILDIELHDFAPNDNLQMALFPSGQNGVGGALCYNQEFYEPGHQGPLVYLNANPDLEVVLERVGQAKGKVLQPKRQISKEIGYMAIIEDSEGNRIALMSQK